MKSLRDFLLAEANNDDKKENSSTTGLPEGFEKIKNQGRLTQEASIAMGGSFKEGMKSAAESSKVRTKIKEELKAGSPNSSSIRDIIKKVVIAKNELDEIFKTKTEKDFGEDGVIISFRSSDWIKLAGTKSSSSRLVKFWLQSSLIAYGYNSKNALRVSFAINYSNNQILIAK